MQNLKAIDPDTLLPASNIGDDIAEIGSPRPSIGPNGVLMKPSLPDAVVALPTFDVGNGVVVIAITIVFGIVTVAVAWITSPAK